MSFGHFGAAGPWLTYAVSLALILGASMFGRWLGARIRARGDDPAQALVGNLQGALFTLLALMVGFSFAMAMSRYDARRGAVLQEANAIGTAALQAQLLPAPQVDAATDLLRAYVRLRLDVARTPQPLDQLTEHISQSNRLQTQLWQIAATANAADPRAVGVGLFAQSLNTMINAQATRLTAARSQVPRVVILLLYAIAMVAMGYTGYGTGASGSPGQIRNVIIGVLIATVIGLIVDIDQPRSGLVTVSQQPILDLGARMGL